MLSKLKIILLLITFIFILSCGDKLKNIWNCRSGYGNANVYAYKEGYFDFKERCFV